MPFPQPVIGSALSMTNIMSKFLCLGISLEDVIRLSTIEPARIIKHPELGSLSVGNTADIAVLEVLKGEFHYTDCSPGSDLTGGGKIRGDRKIQCVMTLFAGEVVFDPTGLTYRYWEDIPKDEDYWIIKVNDKLDKRMTW